MVLGVKGLTSALDVGGLPTPHPGRLTPAETRKLYRTVGGQQHRSGRVRKNSTQPRYDTRTVASRYTYYAVASEDKVEINSDQTLIMFPCPPPKKSTSGPVLPNKGSAEHRAGFREKRWNTYIQNLTYREKHQIFLETQGNAIIFLQCKPIYTPSPCLAPVCLTPLVLALLPNLHQFLIRALSF